MSAEQPAATVSSCPTCGEPLAFEWSNVADGIEWGEARCPNGHIRPCGRNVPSAASGAEPYAKEDGWSALEFYAYIVRTLGLPSRYELTDDGWVAEPPFTKPVPQSILDLLEAHGV